MKKGDYPGINNVLYGKLQQVQYIFKFLQWKLMLPPECFTDSNQIIARENILTILQICSIHADLIPKAQ